MHIFWRLDLFVFSHLSWKRFCVNDVKQLFQSLIRLTLIRHTFFTTKLSLHPVSKIFPNQSLSIHFLCTLCSELIVLTMKRWFSWLVLLLLQRITIFVYIICKKQMSPCHQKMLLFALYSNHYMTTTKIKIWWDTNHLNSV